MQNVIIIVTSLVLGSYLAFSRRLMASPNWKATVTPLAAIGSQFSAAVADNEEAGGLIDMTPLAIRLQRWSTPAQQIKRLRCGKR
jgi:hypothetical protein